MKIRVARNTRFDEIPTGAYEPRARVSTNPGFSKTRGSD
jgi:hypothetical protein